MDEEDKKCANQDILPTEAPKHNSIEVQGIHLKRTPHPLSILVLVGGGGLKSDLKRSAEEV
jgi:hypothetical protein